MTSLTFCFLQLLLVALLLVVMPHRSGKGVAKSLTPDTFSRAAVKMDTIPAGQGSEKYCIIFDAGSTGEPSLLFSPTACHSQLARLAMAHETPSGNVSIMICYLNQVCFSLYEPGCNNGRLFC